MKLGPFKQGSGAKKLNAIIAAHDAGYVYTDDPNLAIERQPDGRLAIRIVPVAVPGGVSVVVPPVLHYYISFTVSIDADEISGGAIPDFFELAEAAESDNTIGFYRDNFDGWTFYGPFGATDNVLLATSETDQPVEDTVHTVTIHLQYDSGSGLLTGFLNVDGIDAGSWTMAGPLAPDVFRFGAIFGGDINAHTLDDLKIGTTPGGTDIFSADFTGGTIVPPFDSAVNDTDLSIVSNALRVENLDGADAYAVVAIGPITL